MNYGDNILSKQIADWTVTNGAINNSGIILEAEGLATLELTQEDISTIPDTMQLYLVANYFTAKYTPKVFAYLQVQTVEDAFIYYSSPVIETISGACSVIMPTTTANYKKLTFNLYSQEAVHFTDWALNKPISTEADVNLDEILEEIPKVLFDYNINTFRVSQREETIALISARLLDNTDVNAKLQITYVASEACTITLRIKDNLGTELYSPILYDVNKGRGSIGVPHAFLKRYIGMHTFTVTAQCSIGTLTFYTRNVLFTLDAGYLALRTIDVGNDVRDLTLKRLDTEAEPSAIYTVGIDQDNIARVRRRLYSDKAEEVWETLFALEEALEAAIEFDGVFEETLSGTFTFYTYEEPAVAWVDLDGNLKIQNGSSEISRITLASGVDKISMVRGYKSERYIAQDQGLIVTYLKAGRAYYRAFQRNEEGIFSWIAETEITELDEGLTSIQIHRLNDYRIGIVCCNITGYRWVITDRTYLGESSPVENLSISISSFENMLYVMPVEYEDFEFNITTEVSDDYRILTVISNIALRFTDDINNCINTSYPIDIIDVQYQDNNILIFLKEPLKTSLIITPKWNKLVGNHPSWDRVWVPKYPWEFRVSYRYLENLSIKVSSLDVVMTVKPLLTLKNNYNEYFNIGISDFTNSMVVKPLTTIKTSNTESLSIAISNFSTSLTVQFVGTIPG